MFTVCESVIEGDEAQRSLGDFSCGAVAVFEGRVRNLNEGQKVEGLEYQVYEELCYHVGEQVIVEAKERFDVKEVRVFHRSGQLKLGEIAFWVGVSSVHRAASFLALPYLVDEMKARLPIWKKEYYVSGVSRWIDCRQCRSRLQEH